MRNDGRRVWLMVVLAGCAGFCVASATAFGYAKLNAWRSFGEHFQLGYVVGYLDAVQLTKRHDPRALVPSEGQPAYERWRDMVNAFYADPANANRAVPDAMAAAGAQIQGEILESVRKRRARPAASPNPDGQAATESPRPLSASPAAPTPAAT